MLTVDKSGTRIFAEALALNEGCGYCIQYQLFSLILETDSMGFTK